MTVQDLIKALQALPKRHKKFDVACLYGDPDNGKVAWTIVTGLDGTYQDDGERGTGKWYVRLKGR